MRFSYLYSTTKIDVYLLIKMVLDTLDPGKQAADIHCTFPLLVPCLFSLV